jgi:hypothetical protein
MTQKFFCDMCDVELPAWSASKTRTFGLAIEGKHLVIVEVRTKQGEVCEACMKKVIAEGQERP